MTIREFKLSDYEEVATMLYELTEETFGNIRRLSPMYFYYQAVSDWIKAEKHIVIAMTDKHEIAGFSLSYVDDFGGLTEPIYNGEFLYVKPEYRKTRAAYLLYNNAVEVAKETNLNLSSSHRAENGADKMVDKHFNLTKMFTNYELRRSV